MKRLWETDELVEHWTLMPPEVELLANKTGATRLGFAVLLKFFQLEALFPQQAAEVPQSVIDYPAILSLEIETINETIAKWPKVTANGNSFSPLTD